MAVVLSRNWWFWLEKQTFVPHERERKIVRGEKRRGELPCWSYTESALPPAEVYCGKLMQLPRNYDSFVCFATKNSLKALTALHSQKL